MNPFVIIVFLWETPENRSDVSKPQLTHMSAERWDKGRVWVFSTILWIGTWKGRA